MKAAQLVNNLLEDDDFDLEAELDQLPDVPKTPATAHSSHGEITFDPRTGRVLADELEYGDGDDDFNELNKPVRFDVEEWKKRYPGKSLVGIYMDILDIGYWMPDGRYEPPADDWRMMFRPGA